MNVFFSITIECKYNIIDDSVTDNRIEEKGRIILFEGIYTG